MKQQIGMALFAAQISCGIRCDFSLSNMRISMSDIKLFRLNKTEGKELAGTSVALEKYV